MELSVTAVMEIIDQMMKQTATTLAETTLVEITLETTTVTTALDLIGIT